MSDNGMTLSDNNGKPFAPMLKDTGKTNADGTPVFLPFYGVAGATPASSNGYATSLPAKGGACVVVDVQATNANQNVGGYLVVVDLAAVPAAGAAINPIKIRRLPTSDGAVDGFAEIDTPLSLANGLVVLLTTSLTTYTPGALSGQINASFY